jgi:gliding motility-associated-like protein
VLFALGNGIDQIAIKIFNRIGEKVFETTSLTFGWDGTYKGVPSKNDVYIYKITLTNSFGKVVNKTGHVSLIK